MAEPPKGRFAVRRLGFVRTPSKRPVAALELHIKNVNPFDNDDNIRYSAYWEWGGDTR